MLRRFNKNGVSRHDDWARAPQGEVSDGKPGLRRRRKGQLGGDLRSPDIQIHSGKSGGRSLNFEEVSFTFFGAYLEEERDGLALAADIAVALTLAAAETGERPRKTCSRRDILRIDLDHDAGAGGRGEDLRAQHACAEQFVLDLVDHATGAIARNHLVCFGGPLGCGARGTDEPQLEIAAVAGKIERELGQIAGIDAEVAGLGGGTDTVDGAVEELAAVADDELAADRAVAQRARGHRHHERLDPAGDDAGRRHLTGRLRRIGLLRCRGASWIACLAEGLEPGGCLRRRCTRNREKPPP